MSGRRGVGVTVGHGEVIPEELAALCGTANRPVREVNLLTEEIDAAADPSPCPTVTQAVFWVSLVTSAMAEQSFWSIFIPWIVV